MQQKCKACDNTVYPMDQLMVDRNAYHKLYFKCSHCKGTLKLQNRLRILLQNWVFLQTRSPSKAAGMFSGTQEKCATCRKTTYPLEKVTVEGQAYHKSCFKCSHGGCPISPSNYAALEGILYCKQHFSQLFKEKGSYNHLIKCAASATPAATTSCL